jgi:hypothetical protein
MHAPSPIEWIKRRTLIDQVPSRTSLNDFAAPSSSSGTCQDHRVRIPPWYVVRGPCWRRQAGEATRLRCRYDGRQTCIGYWMISIHLIREERSLIIACYFCITSTPSHDHWSSKSEHISSAESLVIEPNRHHEVQSLPAREAIAAQDRLEEWRRPTELHHVYA